MSPYTERKHTKTFLENRNTRHYIFKKNGIVGSLHSVKERLAITYRQIQKYIFFCVCLFFSPQYWGWTQTCRQGRQVLSNTKLYPQSPDEFFKLPTPTPGVKGEMPRVKGEMPWRKYDFGSNKCQSRWRAVWGKDWKMYTGFACY
jgi:hypothetical protein